MTYRARGNAINERARIVTTLFGAVSASEPVTLQADIF